MVKLLNPLAAELNALSDVQKTGI